MRAPKHHSLILAVIAAALVTSAPALAQTKTDSGMKDRMKDDPALKDRRKDTGER